MEKTKCYMWLKNKHVHHPCTKPMKKLTHETYLLWKEHQEEVAFVDKVVARGTTNIEGGCGSLWPPRSYACSFCKREFKSAQALGGHMNVHRRDRALLKQVTINNPNNPNKINNNNNNNNNNISNKNNSILPSSQLRSLNNNSKHISKSMLAKKKPSHLISPRKSFASHNSTSNISSKFSQSSPNYYGSANKVDQHVRDGNLRGERDDGYLSYKRSKKNGEYVALLPSFLGETIKRSSVRNDIGLQVPEILAFKASSSIDDLDLELRLGNSSQKV